MTKSIRVLATGNLRHAFPAIFDAFIAATGIRVSPALGPAGPLRERKRAGSLHARSDPSIPGTKQPGRKEVQGGQT